MLPTLFRLGPIPIYSMGILLTVGLFLGLYYWWKLGRDEHLEEVHLFDAFFLSLIAFLIIGRVGYVALHAEDLGTVYRLLAFLRYPGISYSVGVTGALISLISYARGKEWDVWKILDAAAVALSLILVFGAFGAFLNGSNPGRELTWGLVFPGSSGHRFPVDLFGAVWYLITFGTVARVRKNFRFYSWYKGDASVARDGLAMLTFLFLTGIYFVVVGFVNDNVAHLGFVPYLSLAGLLLMVGSAVAIMQRSGRDYRVRIAQALRRSTQGGV